LHCCRRKRYALATSSSPDEETFSLRWLEWTG
jgi:hypothetical protein